MVVKIDYSVFYILFCFLIIYLVARKTVFRPLNRIIDARHELIEASNKAAAGKTEKYEELLTGYNSKIAEARSDGFSSRQKLREEGLMSQQELIDQARKEASGRLTEAMAEIGRSTEEGRRLIKRDSEELAERIARVVLGGAR
jgi:F-type H+-transporting ATPase subunit b